MAAKKACGEAAPRPLNDVVRRQMKSMPRRDTAVELSLRRAMHRLGLRYRVHLRGLPGTPDIALTKARIAIFVDGCFWHRCPEHGTAPKNNSGWWAKKLDENVARDRRKDIQLEELGWTAVHVWEHEDPMDAAEKIRRIWWERVRGSAGHTHQAEDPWDPGRTEVRGGYAEEHVQCHAVSGSLDGFS